MKMRDSAMLIIKITTENANVSGLMRGTVAVKHSIEAPKPTKAMVPGMEPRAVAKMKGQI
jgi:hypothetical protein